MSNLYVHQESTSFRAAKSSLRAYAEGKTDYLQDCLPSATQDLDGRAVLDALYRRLGPVLAKALRPDQQIDSPLLGKTSGEWLKQSSSMGINLRTTGGFLRALKYVMTLPPHINSIHLLPVFEPGVVGSLYGMASWRINNEFFDRTWARIVPSQRHVNDQLRAFVNICHALGKAVGLDVIPHTDRFSEIVLVNPWLFEWFKRDDATLLSHRTDLHEEVAAHICGFATGRLDIDANRAFFSRSEEQISTILFGNGDVGSRNARRDELISYLYNRGYETLPATMAPPYRVLELDPTEEAVTVDEKGRRWREFRFIAPQEMSRVFGPLTRYKVWERKDDNQAWEIDHDTPRMAAFNYVANHYAAIVAQYGFDYMRGDMSHVQTRAEGVPKSPADPYDILRYVKRKCAEMYPHFAYFAESFLTEDDYMTYGSETAHLNASEAEVALGNLQNYAPHDPTFHRLLAEYDDIAAAGKVLPSFTLFSADKDDPRFDAFYEEGNVARYFFSCFCSRFPSYNSLGFRQRDKHTEPAPNEHYTKLFVFYYSEGAKGRKGPYVWGENETLWQAISNIDSFSCADLKIRQNLGFSEIQTFEWLLAPDATGKRQMLVWQVNEQVFAVNFGKKAATIPASILAGKEMVFTTSAKALDTKRGKLFPDSGIVLSIKPAELSTPKK
ncbi:MAG: hypothetical protein AB8F78_19210 [Saprospiraceae bacterium]